MFVRSTLIRKFVVLFILLSLAACSSTSDRKAYYQKRGPDGLEVPPDLVLPQGNKALDIPSVGFNQASLSELNEIKQRVEGEVLSTGTTDARLVRDGSMVWLEINAPAVEIWDHLTTFFRNEGFEFVISDKRIGFLETDWQENHVGRLALGDNWLSNLLNRTFADGIKDKYRIHLEKTETETIRIFISHSGLREKVQAGGVGEIVQTYWEQSDPEPELEAEMMQRFLVFRGMGEGDAKHVVAAKKIQERAILKQDADRIYLEVTENFARSWRRIGITLDRLGILVEDRNRSEGMYFIKVPKEYWQSNQKKVDKGFFAGMFSSKKEYDEKQFILKLSKMGDRTQVSLLDRDGNSSVDEVSADLMKQFQRYLR